MREANPQITQITQKGRGNEEESNVSPSSFAGVVAIETKASPLIPSWSFLSARSV